MEPDDFIDEAIRLPRRSQLALAAACLERTMAVTRSRLQERGDDRLIEDVLSLAWNVVESGEARQSALAVARDACLEAAPHTEDDPEAADVTFSLTAAASLCDLAEGSDPREALRGVIYSSLDAIEHYEGSQRDAGGGRSRNGRRPNLIDELVPVLRELQKLGDGRVSRSTLLEA